MDLIERNVLIVLITLAGFVGLLSLLHLQERAVGRYLSHHLGWRATLVTGWLGVPLHEFSHFVTAKAFGHRVLAWKLFDPDPASGTLGYVRHAYSQRTPLQMVGYAVIAIAPVIFGGVALLALLWWASGGIAPLKAAGQDLTAALDAQHFTEVGRGLWHTLVATCERLWSQRSWTTPIQLYLMACVASHMAPSRSDFETARIGMATTIAVILIGAITCGALGISLARAPAWLIPFLLICAFAALVQVIYAATVAIFLRITG